MPDRAFDRDMVWTAAALAVAAAKHTSRKVSPTDEAKRLLRQYPGVEISVDDLAAEIARLQDDQAKAGITSRP